MMEEHDLDELDGLDPAKELDASSSDDEADKKLDEFEKQQRKNIKFVKVLGKKIFETKSDPAIIKKWTDVYIPLLNQ